MDGSDAVYSPRPINAAPASARPAIVRFSDAPFVLPAISTPTATPANTNPAHGNKVNVVCSPAGRRYHWSSAGSESIERAERTIGVTIAVRIAAAAERIPAPRGVAAAPQTSAATASDGPITFRMSTRIK